VLTFSSGDLMVDLDKHTVRVKGKMVELTPKEFDLLTVLI
jgi:DNA-binding response OmpR family regulator